MIRRKFLLVLSAVTLVLSSCATTPRDLPPVRGIAVIADEEVMVGSAGGYGTVPFDAEAQQKVLILMLARATTMEPYGYLETPDGEGTYTPENGKAVNGWNSSEVTIPSGGHFTLTVFDGANEGGSVHVRVELLE